jgi:hypothetical protein
MIIAGAVGGALGNLAAQGINCADKGGDACSTHAFVTAGVTGFVGGAVGGLAGPLGGKIAGAVIGDFAGSLGGRIAGGAISGAVSGGVSGGAVGALGYGMGCMSGAECSGSGLLSATAHGAKDGAIGGAAGGGFGGIFSKGRPGGGRPTGDDHVDLYHGTSKKGATSVRSNGIDLSVQRPDSDFGRGFYTTRDANQAAEWAGRNPGGGEVLHYRVPKSELAGLNSLKFPTANSAWERFVLWNRSGGPLHDFDTVEGPMLMNPDHALNGKAPTAGGHQLSFHTDRAVSMLDRYLVP